MHFSKIVSNLTSPEVDLLLENATLNLQLPKQDADCGLFVCCHAIDYWSGATEFSAPVKLGLRNEINAVLMDIIDTRTKFEDKKPFKSLHPILAEFVAVLEDDQETNPQNTIEEVFAKAVSAKADLHPNKYKPKKTHYTSNRRNQFIKRANCSKKIPNKPSIQSCPAQHHVPPPLQWRISFCTTPKILRRLWTLPSIFHFRFMRIETRMMT